MNKIIGIKNNLTLNFRNFLQISCGIILGILIYYFIYEYPFQTSLPIRVTGLKIQTIDNNDNPNIRLVADGNGGWESLSECTNNDISIKIESLKYRDTPISLKTTTIGLNCMIETKDYGDMRLDLKPTTSLKGISISYAIFLTKRQENNLTNDYEGP